MSGAIPPVTQQVVDIPLIHHASDPVQSEHAVADPAVLASAWLPREGEERMLMTLATIHEEGFPRSRTVMLSDFDGERFAFHTDRASRKASELRRDPRVSLTIRWPGFTRQMVVQGTAEEESPAEAAAAYAKRSPYLQQLAWLNTAEYASLPLAERTARWAEFEAANPELCPPEGWVGFRVTPHRMLFWVSNPAAASRRVEYTRSDTGWARRYLPG